MAEARIADLARRLRSRQRLTTFANMVEVGLASLPCPQPSARLPEPVRIVLGSDGAEVEVEDAGDGTIRRSPFLADPGVASAMAREGLRRVDLVLGEGSCLDIAFVLPEASIGELRKMIAHEIAFQSPVDPGRALSAWSALHVAEEGDARWHVSAAIALREGVAPVLDAVDAAGIRIVTVRRRLADGGGWAAAPEWAKGRAAGARGPVRRALGTALRLPAVVAVPAALGLAFFAVAGLRYADLAVERASLARQVVEARGRIAEATRLALRQRALEEARDLSALRLATVGHIAAALPDDTWLDSLTVAREEVELSGTGPSAARTTEDLAKTPGLGALRFAAPIARDSRLGSERFRIAATLVAPAGETPQ